MSRRPGCRSPPVTRSWSSRSPSWSRRTCAAGGGRCRSRWRRWPACRVCTWARTIRWTWWLAPVPGCCSADCLPCSWAYPRAGRRDATEAHPPGQLTAAPSSDSPVCSPTYAAARSCGRKSSVASAKATRCRSPHRGLGELVRKPVLPRASVVLTGAAPSKQGRQVGLITLVRDGRLLLIDVALVEARPSPWRQAVDLANMMLCLALRSSAEQVYRRALRQFSVDEISEGFAAARGLALPSQLRGMLRAQGRDLHGEFVRLLPTPPQPIRVQRWSARRIGLWAVIVAVLVLLELNQRSSSTTGWPSGPHSASTASTATNSSRCGCGPRRCPRRRSCPACRRGCPAGESRT